MTTAPLTDVQLVELERCALVEEGSDEDGYPFCDSRSHAVVWDALPQLIAQCKRAITLESELAQLRRGIVANAGLLSNLRLPRWAHVRNAVGVGSTSARSMCRDAGFDPEELVGNP